MFDPTDYYGNKYKWFIGKVKDTKDPLNSNRVKVNIFGIHPDEQLIADDMGSYQSGSGTTGGGDATVGGYTVNQNPPTSLSNLPAASGSELLPIDRNTLVNPSQMSAKISKYFTLQQLIFSGKDTAATNQANLNLLSQDIIYNLTNLAVNALDPIQEKFGNIHINSGWRAPAPANGKLGMGENHPKGYAADISYGGSAFDLAQWIVANMKGRFSLLILEYAGSSKWCHVQLGSSGVRNQGSTAKPLIQTYHNNQYTNGLTLYG